MRTLLAASAVALAAFVSNSASTTSAPGATCMRTAEVEIAEGRLVVAKVGQGTAYVLVVPRPTCLNGPTASDRVKRFSRIQLAPTNGAQRDALARFAGKHVHARGHASAANAGFHAAPVVMNLMDIDAI